MALRARVDDNTNNGGEDDKNGSHYLFDIKYKPSRRPDAAMQADKCR